jgi:hypothetical protein
VRTTLTLDDDVLLAAQELARRQKRSVGVVLSELARRGLTQGASHPPTAPSDLPGFDPLPRRGTPVTRALVQRLLEDDTT